MKPSRLTAIILLLIIAIPAFGTEVLPRNIEQMTQISKRLFHGRCINAEENFNPQGISYTEYTFEVLSVVKGQMAETITFRQYGLINPVKAGNGLIYMGNVAGMPVYKPGREYLLFLIGDSKLGLTSPAGLFQGSFKVLQNQNGERIAVNALNNKGLFKNIDTSNNTLLKSVKSKQEEGGPISLNTLLDVVRTLNK